MIAHILRRSWRSMRKEHILRRSLSQKEHKLLGQCKVMYDVDQLKHITRKTKLNKSVLADNPTTFTVHTDHRQPYNLYNPTKFTYGS